MTTGACGRPMLVAVLATGLAACGGGGGGGSIHLSYTLTVVKAGSGTGTVTGGGISCGATCSASLTSGTAVTLTAAADAGSTFVGWTGCDSATGAACNLTMGADRPVIATFELVPVNHTLTVVKAGNGAGTVTGGGISCGATCSDSVASGAGVTLTATADAGSTFAGWTGCDSATGTTCSVTMAVDRSVTATFDTVGTTHALTVVKAGNGTGTVTGGGISCGATCSASLTSGTAVTLTAAADAGSTFVGWTGCDSATGTTCSVTMAVDRSVTATFASGRGSLQVVNSTTFVIAELYASPAGAGAWGQDLLAAQINPTGTYTLTPLPVGSYDFRAVASDGISHWQTNTVAITDGGTFSWTLLPPDMGSLSVVNHHCIEITELYVRPSLSPSWSPNQLASPVGSGAGTFTLDLPAGTYDLSAVGADTLTWATNGIVIPAAGTFTWSLYMAAGTGCLTVVNNTADTIEFLFDPPSPSGCTGNNWGTERLWPATILPTASFTISNIPQGAHDLRAMGVSSIDGSTVDYRACGMSIPAGGTFLWYLSLP